MIYLPRRGSGIDRRGFVKRLGLFLPTIFIPRFLSAQSLETARGLAIRAARKTGGGGGGGGGGNQYTLINHASAGFGTGEASAGPIDTTGSNLFVGIGSWFTGTPSGPSDTASNTWNSTLTTYSDGSGNYNQKMFFVIDPTTNPVHFFNYSASFLLFQIAAFAVAGRTPVFDVANGYTHPNAESDSSFQTGNVTPAGDNELIVAGASWNNTVTGSINSSLNIIEQQQQGVNAIFAALAWQAQTTGMARNPTWSFTGAVTAATGCIGAFK